VPERLFLFLQMEFPWALGPADGRYLLRAPEGAEPERVVVLGTVGARVGPAARALRGPLRVLPGARRGHAQATAEPAEVATARATIVDPISLSAERQAQAWLDELDPEREAQAAVAVLNRVLHFHRIASADPYLHEVSPAQALVIRAGWGEGEQVADGRWLHARELPLLAGARRPASTRRRVLGDRSAALRPQERLAELLSARGSTLLCEDLALRARLDLDQGRMAHAAIELQAAYTAALRELRSERREDLAIRIAELAQLNAGVVEQARAVLGVTPAESAEPTDSASAGGDSPPAGRRPATGDSGATGGRQATGDRQSAGGRQAAGEGGGTPLGNPDEDVVRHALERLEAALRARTAPGFHR
jgi:hypothetical protein